MAMPSANHGKHRGDKTSVLFAIDTLDHGGPDRVFFELLRALPRDRFTLSLATRRAQGRYFSQLPGDIALEVLGARRYPIFALARAVRRRHPDIVFTTLNMNLTAFAARPFFPRRTRHVARIANHLSSNFQELFRRSWIKHRLAYWFSILALRAADEVVCQSRDMADELSRLTRRKTSYPVIGNPIDAPRVQELAERGGSLPGDPALFAVGRLSLQKGYDLLIKAMPEVIRHCPNAVLTIAGDGEMRPELEALIGTLNLTGKVRLPGEGNEIYAQMRSAKLFVSPSRYEGFANVILEAMACGTPVVATDCPGATRELIESGKTGWLTPPENPAALAECIVHALRADLEGSARRALLIVHERFAPPVVAAQYERVFSAVVGAP
jgi:glycosyltransferase involved in cell wall biosynthesis